MGIRLDLYWVEVGYLEVDPLPFPCSCSLDLDPVEQVVEVRLVPALAPGLPVRKCSLLPPSAAAAEGYTRQVEAQVVGSGGYWDSAGPSDHSHPPTQAAEAKDQSGAVPVAIGNAAEAGYDAVALELANGPTWRARRYWVADGDCTGYAKAVACW
jgi:hypothetical protein